MKNEYILSETHRLEQNGIPVDYSQMTIEHIYPENPKGSKKLPDTVIGQLGNLILIDQGLNDKLANKSFLEKKKILV